MWDIPPFMSMGIKALGTFYHAWVDFLESNDRRIILLRNINVVP